MIEKCGNYILFHDFIWRYQEKISSNGSDVRFTSRISPTPVIERPHLLTDRTDHFHMIKPDAPLPI
jgi:hypothetical protein